MGGPLKDPQMSVSVGVRSDWYECSYSWSSNRDQIISILLEPIPGRPVSSPIVFVNPMLVLPTPFVSYFVDVSRSDMSLMESGV
jgi:hypothetical protein